MNLNPTENESYKILINYYNEIENNPDKKISLYINSEMGQLAKKALNSDFKQATLFLKENKIAVKLKGDGKLTLHAQEVFKNLLEKADFKRNSAQVTEINESLSHLHLEVSLSERMKSTEPWTKEEVSELMNALPEFEKNKEVELQKSWYLVKSLHELFIEVEQKGKENVVVSTETSGHKGWNGSYFITINNEKKWIFKPESQEVKSVEGIEKGKGAIREQLAYLIHDKEDRFYSVPETYRIVIEDEVGSLQKMVLETQSYTVISTSEEGPMEMSKISAEQLQISLLFDLRFNNTDRHGGNLLLRKEENTYSVHMIDHGGCLSASPKDPLKIEQHHSLTGLLKWDQAIKEHAETLTPEVIETQTALLRENGIEEEAILRMQNGTRVVIAALQESKAGAAEIEITPSDLASLFLKLNSDLFETESTENIISFVKQIVEEKNRCAEFGSSKAKVMRARMQYAKKQHDTRLVNLLYGDDPRVQIRDVDYTSSLIGKMLNS